jgi:hypothetical protein
MIVDSMLNALPTLAIITGNLCAKLKHIFGKCYARLVKHDTNHTNETLTHVGTEMEAFTLTVNKQQKELIVAALEKIAHMTMGQTFQEQEHAKKMLGHFTKNRHSSTIDLSKVGVE